jgi:capsule polysaccharide export protein KpsE/RkpR
VEIQKVLATQASEIQKEWLDSTGKKTAIQTNIAVLQPYLSESQTTQMAEMSAKLDNLFLKDGLSTMGDIQRSLNTSDYYANLTYIKMLEIHESWKLLLDILKNIQTEISTLQASMETVQNAVLDVLHEKVKVGRENIDSAYGRLKTSVTDGTKLKDITMTIDPQIQSLSEKTTTDIPACIVVLKQTSEIESQLKKYSS